MEDPAPILLHGDCLEKMNELQPGSVDCVINDPPYLEMSDGSGREVELAHERRHAVDAHAHAGSAVDIHRLRRTVEDPHQFHVSDVVAGDDGESASDVRVAPDDAPHVD